MRKRSKAAIYARWKTYRRNNPSMWGDAAHTSRRQRVLNAVLAWLTAGLLFLFSFCAIPLNGFNPVSGVTEVWIVRRPLTQEFDCEVEKQ